MSDFLLLSLCLGLLLALLLTLFWLSRQYRRLRLRLDELEQTVKRNNEDIAGLCSAAVAVDHRMLGNDKQLQSIAEKLANYQPQTATEPQTPPSSYQSVIEKIHQGADVEELVREYGLSREEAALLIRLNAAK